MSSNGTLLDLARAVALAWAVGTLLLSPDLRAAEAPTPSTDQVQGGLILEPHRFADGRPVERLDPEGFRVRMVDADDGSHEVHDHPAGVSFVPPPGRWRVWLEGPGWMTPFTDLLVVKGRPGDEGPLRVRPVPVVPAGRVDRPTTKVQPTDEVRLLFAGEDPVFGAIRPELTRRQTVDQWPSEGVQMPQGRAVSAVWRPPEDRYVALSRPFTVTADEGQSPIHEAPRPGTGHLIAYLERGPGTRPVDVEGLEVRLRSAGGGVEPALTVRTAWGAYAFWYDLPQGATHLEVGGGRLGLEPVPVSIVAGEVGRTAGTLIPVASAKGRAGQDEP